MKIQQVRNDGRMNTHDDLLNYNDDRCSFCENDVSNMCSNDGHDTCGDKETTRKISVSNPSSKF